MNLHDIRPRTGERPLNADFRRAWDDYYAQILRDGPPAANTMIPNRRGGGATWITNAPLPAEGTWADTLTTEMIQREVERLRRWTPTYTADMLQPPRPQEMGEVTMVSIGGRPLDAHDVGVAQTVADAVLSMVNRALRRSQAVRDFRVRVGTAGGDYGDPLDAHTRIGLRWYQDR